MALPRSNQPEPQRPGEMAASAAADAPARTMDRPSATAAFYRTVKPFSGFRGIIDPSSFVAVPDRWCVGVADITGSTEAIAAGHYKVVNTAGAAVISAQSNALGSLDFPFIFAGDGASFAVAPEDAAQAGEALAATIAWVGRELGLTLRGAMVPVAHVRAAGCDVKVARFAASPNLSYAMFSGGGLAWAEQQLKGGTVGLGPAPQGSQPDLTGLSCRFQDLKAKHGTILSLLVRPTVRPDDARFQALVADLLVIAERDADAARPRPALRLLGGIRFGSIGLNARLRRRPGEGPIRSLIGSAAATLAASVMLGFRVEVRGFSARTYLRQVAENSDFRKYGDGLMMTLDCGENAAIDIERRLRRAETEAVALSGLHRQDAATITCIVPTLTRSNHIHFIDGASGGYAMAARDLKSRLDSAVPL